MASPLSGLLFRRWLAARTRLVAGHPGAGRPVSPALQFGNSPLHPLLFQNHGLQLGDDGDEDSAVGVGQVNISIHSLLYDRTTATHARVRQPKFAQFPKRQGSLRCIISFAQAKRAGR